MRNKNKMLSTHWQIMVALSTNEKQTHIFISKSDLKIKLICQYKDKTKNKVKHMLSYNTVNQNRPQGLKINGRVRH